MKKISELHTDGLNKLAKDVLEINKANGWHDGKQHISELLMLIVTEVAEACEADRKDRWANYDGLLNAISAFGYGKIDAGKGHFKINVKDTFEDEIADTIIRCLDLCGLLGIDIESHIQAKLMYSQTRGYHHGGKEY